MYYIFLQFSIEYKSKRISKLLHSVYICGLHSVSPLLELGFIKLLKLFSIKLQKSVLFNEFAVFLRLYCPLLHISVLKIHIVPFHDMDFWFNHIFKCTNPAELFTDCFFHELWGSVRLMRASVAQLLFWEPDKTGKLNQGKIKGRRKNRVQCKKAHGVFKSLRVLLRGGGGCNNCSRPQEVRLNKHRALGWKKKKLAHCKIKGCSTKD